MNNDYEVMFISYRPTKQIVLSKCSAEGFVVLITLDHKSFPKAPNSNVGHVCADV